MHPLTELIQCDMKPALGVTEPGAIAFAVSSAKRYLSNPVENVYVLLNSGMYKNAFTCGIPNSDHVGNVYAAALGAIAANPDKGLECLEDVKDKDQLEAEKMVENGAIQVHLDHISSKIYIEAKVRTQTEECVVKISGSHTNIVSISVNGEMIFEKDGEKEEETDTAKIHQYFLKDLWTYANEVPEEEILFIGQAFEMNMALLEEGLHSSKTTIGPLLLRRNGDRMLSDDPLATAQLWCNGAIEARVLGLSKPAMSITGSGAHGIIATLPLHAYQQVKKNEISKGECLRAAALSYLITMYIKEYSGKLSAFCGCGIAAGTGMACGLTYLMGGKEEEIVSTIRNMASGITGMICDGGNQGCAMKGIVAVDAAFRAAELSIAQVSIDSCHGINGKTPEDTMRYMGRIASPGMEDTERIIVEIMKEKRAES